MSCPADATTHAVEADVAAEIAADAAAAADVELEEPEGSAPLHACVADAGDDARCSAAYEEGQQVLAYYDAFDTGVVASASAFSAELPPFGMSHGQWLPRASHRPYHEP